MRRGVLYVGVFTLYLLVCACKQKANTVGSPPQSGGVPFVQVKAIPTSAPDTPPAIPGNIQDKTLPKEVMEALATYDPGFHVWALAAYPPEKLTQYPYSAKSIPYAVSGDYNGDGKEDMALAGHNKDANIVVALISTVTGYHVIEVQKTPCYSMSRAKGKEIPYTADGILLFQRKGSRYVVGDTETGKVILKTDGFAVQHIRWFNHETSEFVPSGRISDVYEWDQATLKFHSNFLEDEAATTIAKYALRTDFRKAVFEEKTRGLSRGGASVRIAVKSASGEWVEQSPLRKAAGASYYTFSPGTEIKMIYSCASSPDPAVNYWKAVVSHQSSSPQDLEAIDDNTPNPIISRVLPVGTSFGYYWTVPNLKTEINEEAVFSYACSGSKITTAISTNLP